ncbi:MAG: lysophospholipid acyltransferase family protein [Pseudodonghicola sp.]
MSLRKKIADSAAFARIVTGLFAGYIRLAHATSRWRREGFEPMDVALRAGEPVIFVVWHQRLMMAPYMFDLSLGPICSLTSAGRAGRMVGALLGRFGWENISMSSHKRHVALSREVLRRMKQGVSVGIAADGPRGPARVSSTVPLVWAKSSGCRVFAVSFSANRVVEFPTWDRMWLPAPFSRGVFRCAEWTATVPRQTDEAELEALRQSFEATLDAVTAASDRAAGRPVGTSDQPRRG